ncbi:hypothetical protein TP48_11920 [Xanthomonas citri pv. citri]|nr:hypothetical protein TP48_11920 [Xanthomonas citri pv. citri]PWE98578.1 hypothetical protein TP44_12720 [Xanthomonas citri pv. citri]PWF05815.1 hypothetical protein TP43_17050 [Xanthomonas citri pv. citri]PWF07754.1 hypothetical protein TP39_09555 [Xanthomonas citri pv. citri]PWF18763.1 hypothetical protein TP40_01985 [Xanthomonas citri pv. citri]
MAHKGLRVRKILTKWRKITTTVRDPARPWRKTDGAARSGLALPDSGSECCDGCGDAPRRRRRGRCSKSWRMRSDQIGGASCTPSRGVLRQSRDALRRARVPTTCRTAAVGYEQPPAASSR